HRALGQYARAAEHLTIAHRSAVEIGDRGRQIRVLARSGALAVASGQYLEAEDFLSQALLQAKDQGQLDLVAMVQNDLGNLYQFQQRYTEAVQAYTDSLSASSGSSNQWLASQAHINQAMALMKLSRHHEAAAQLESAWTALGAVDPSHDHVYALLAVGLAYDKLRLALPSEHAKFIEASFRAYHKAADESTSLNDYRAASYAWGYLGALYEVEERYSDGLELTRRAVLAGQQAAAPESLYRWHWQTGRLLAKLGKENEAIDAYRRGVFVLRSVRAEMLAASGPASTPFRQAAGGLYYELADLLLRHAASSPHTEAAQILSEARDTIELLKADELRNYFGDECVDSARSRIASLEQIATTAAVIYPILLPDRLELLVSLPDGLRRVAVSVSADRVTNETRQLRHFLEKRTTNEYLPHAQQLYDWLIRPLEALWSNVRPTTLVFVPDGPLRTIPMAALHDGNAFLIQRYAIATTPGLTLTDPQPLRRQSVQALAAGLTDSVQGFPALPYVEEETRSVHRFFGGDLLLNRDFVVPRVESELKDHEFSIVHIASHGKFDSDARKSFILAYDDKLTMDRLDRFVGVMRYRAEPLGLLTLSACETAEGDDRAALGLAGVAIKAGARSALATLWSINDESSSELVRQFYRNLLDPTLSKAVALQRAQLSLLEHPMYQHPTYWAPFLLLNNWL
ncbi:MAG TPA: CHAT domain-containing protein, partial [Nitrospiraceae bacterium]